MFGSRIGLAINLLLALLIVKVKRTDIGAYRYLQLTFVVNDITFATYSFVMKDKIITKDYSFAMFNTVPYGNNIHLVCTYGSLFSLILVIVSFNFLYRYWAVVNPSLIRLFTTPWFPFVLAFIAFFEFSVWYVDCYFLFEASTETRADLVVEFEQKYRLDAMTHVIVLGNYWRDGRYNAKPVLGLAIFFGIIIIAVAFMTFCTTSILRLLSQAKAMSAKTKQLQYALFRSLAVQIFFPTLIPYVFLHTNAGVALSFPLLGIDISWYSDWVNVSCSSFPPLDAIAMIMLMRDYRETVLDVLLCRKCRLNAKTAPSSVNANSGQIRDESR